MVSSKTGIRATPEQVSYAYQLFMLFLCVYAIFSLLAGVLLPLRPEVVRILEYVDYLVCAAFFVDFIHSLRAAENKKRYFFTWGWIDLLSSIPAVGWLRVGRFARVVRIIRVLRALRAMRLLVTHLVRQRLTSAFYSILAVSFSVVVVGAIAVLHFEIGGPGSIQTAGDALWWAMTTITTVGYGDTYPVTPEGRVVAAMLMTAGVGLFGTLSGVIAGWFLAPDEPKPEPDSELTRLQASVDELRAMVEKLSRPA